MSVLSKLKNKILMEDYALPYNCYELGHTWTPYCSDAHLSIAINVLKESLKMYSLLYFLTQFVFARKFGVQNFKITIQSIIRSTSFLSFNALFTLCLFCFSRQLAGKFYLPIVSHLPAMISSFAALKIERQNRRSALAFYCTNIAFETIIFGNLNVRNNIKRLKEKNNLPIPKYLLDETNFQNGFLSIIFSLFKVNGDDFKRSTMYLFGVTSIIYLTKLKSDEQRILKLKADNHLNKTGEKKYFKKEHEDLVCLAFRYLIGDQEFDDNHELNELDIESNNLNSIKSVNNSDIGIKLDSKNLIDINLDKKDMKSLMNNLFAYKHKTTDKCLTNDQLSNCLKSSLSCMLRGGTIGFLSNFLLSFGMHLKNNKFKLNQSFWSLLMNKKNFKFGLLISSFNGFYKLMNCFLHRIEKKKSNWHSVLSSIVGICLPKLLFNKFVTAPNLNLTQYLFWKSIENWFWHFANAYHLKQAQTHQKYVKLINDKLIKKENLKSIKIDNELIKLDNQKELNILGEKSIKELINKNLNNDQLNDKIKKLTINDTLQLKKLADKLTQIESKQNFNIFNYISSDNLVGLIYSLSVSQLFYVAVMQPQKLRHSYMKFLDRCTDNKLRLLNRDIIDFFGVKSSAGYLPYNPILDFRFTSRKFQEAIQVWTI